MIEEKPKFLKIDEILEGKSDKAKGWIKGAKEQAEKKVTKIKVTKKVWLEWKRKEKGEQPTPPSVAKKVNEIMKNLPDTKPPIEFISRMEFRVLLALNGHERTITQIFRKAKIGYSDVHRTIYKLEDDGLVDILGKRKHRMGIFVKATQKGINKLVTWQEIHGNNF